jgi:hypothetical protein
MPDPRAWQPAVPPRTFVPVGEMVAPRRKPKPIEGHREATGEPLPFGDPAERWEERTSLFGEAER